MLPDTDAPIFDSQPAVISDISCYDPLPIQEVLTATDSCSGATVTASVDPYVVDVCAGYAITYRWIAVDTCGNADTVTQTFNVLPDSDAPIL